MSLGPLAVRVLAEAGQVSMKDDMRGPSSTSRIDLRPCGLRHVPTACISSCVSWDVVRPRREGQHPDVCSSLRPNNAYPVVQCLFEVNLEPTFSSFYSTISICSHSIAHNACLRANNACPIVHNVCPITRSVSL